MENGYRELFVKYLIDTCHYPEETFRKNIYKYDGKEYGRVEVLFNGYVIQAFVLMSDEHCKGLEKFPFYRTYGQWNESGNLTPPACNVAVCLADGVWAIHSSSNLRHEITNPDFLDYDKAVDRFRIRLGFVGNEKQEKIIRRLSLVAISLVAIYVAAYILSINGSLCDVIIPLDSVMASILILVVVLILLPPLIPFLKIKYKGISMEINQD